MTVKLQFLVNQTDNLFLYFDWPLPDGAAKLVIEHTFGAKDGDIWLAEESITRDTSQDADMDAVALQGATSYSIAAGDASKHYVGQRRWIVDVEGRPQEITVDGLDSTAGTVFTDQPLRYAHTASSKTYVLRFKKALSAGLLSAKVRNLNATWHWLINSGDRRKFATQSFDIVKNPFDITIVERDIKRVCPWVLKTLRRRESWLPKVENALEDVEMQLHGDLVYPDMIIKQQMLKRLVLMQLALDVLDDQSEQNTAKVERWIKKRDRELQRLTDKYEFQVFVDDTLAEDEADELVG